jgi:hypothetical protein
MLSRWTNSTQAIGKNIVNKDGGKIAEKANATGNTADTKLWFGLVKTDTRLLNSVSLKQVSRNKLVRHYSEDSSPRPDRKKPSIADLKIGDFNEIAERVTAKQIELVKLAELEGIRSKKVKDLQTQLAKS